MKRNWITLTLSLGLAAGVLWLLWRPGSTTGGAAFPGGINPQAGDPPPSLWTVEGSETLQKPTPNGEWVTLDHPSYEYEFSFPSDWKVEIPKGFTRDRGRLLTNPKHPGTRIVIVPWGIYDLPLKEELAKAETGWLLSGQDLASHKKTREELHQVGGRPAVVRHYSAVLRSQGGKGPRCRAIATYVVARPKCYALVLLGPQEDVERLAPIYDRLVDSFKAPNPDGKLPADAGEAALSPTPAGPGPLEAEPGGPGAPGNPGGFDPAPPGRDLRTGTPPP